MKLTRRDREAMARAIEQLRQQGGEDARQIEDKLARDPWEKVGSFASYSRQDTNLCLKPWQVPPCWLRTSDDLKSALAMPQARFGGQWFHPTLHEMAAAYLFHLIRNHPFIDGNKRAGLVCAIAFLGLNGLELIADPDDLVELVLGVAEGTTDKAQVGVFLKANTR